MCLIMYYFMNHVVLTLILLFVPVCSIDFIHKFITVCLSSVFLPVDFLRNLFSSTLGLGSPEKVLDELTLEGVARYIKSGKCKSTCVCLEPSSSNYAHSELIYSYSNAVVIDWLGHSSASAQVKTFFAWLEQEYPHVSIPFECVITYTKKFNNPYIKSVLFVWLPSSFLHFHLQQLVSQISVHQEQACMQICRNITCLTQRPSSRSITLR